MIPVFQQRVIHNNNQTDCFNACIASIMELPLRQVLSVVPTDEGSWLDRWRIWLADKGFKLSFSNAENPPAGYSIAAVYTERLYPANHKRAGINISHTCVAFDGIIVHDPYPLGSQEKDIRYYNALFPLSTKEKQRHEELMVGGKCIHGYRHICGECPPL